MTTKKGTPNQKALYARDGFAMEDLQEMLESVPEADIHTRLAIYDRMVAFSSEMTKIRATEIIASKVSGEPIRCIEHKQLDQYQIAPVEDAPKIELQDAKM